MAIAYDPEVGDFYDTETGDRVDQSSPAGRDFFSTINDLTKSAGQIIGLTRGTPGAAKPAASKSAIPTWLLPVAIGVGVILLIVAFVRK